MFGLGMGELLVILAVALLVLGPTKLPELASGLGKAIRDFRRATRDLKDQIEVDETVRRPFQELQAALRDEPPPPPIPSLPPLPPVAQVAQVPQMTEEPALEAAAPAEPAPALPTAPPPAAIAREATQTAAAGDAASHSPTGRPDGAA